MGVDELLIGLEDEGFFVEGLKVDGSDDDEAWLDERLDMDDPGDVDAWLKGG